MPDDAYLPALVDLGREELWGKLVLLRGSDDPAPELQQLAIPTVPIDELFIQGVARSANPRPLRIALAPHNNIPRVASANSHSTTGGGVTSPESSEINSQVARQSLSSPPTVTPGQPIDPSKVGLAIIRTCVPLTETTDTLHIIPQPLHKRESPLDIWKSRVF